MNDPRNPVNIFIGVDPRQPVAFTTLANSLTWHCKRAIAIHPLRLPTLPITRRGLTEFTFSRFLVPWLCDYRGSAIFMDADIIVTDDIGELLDCADATFDVQVMRRQPRFEWPSVMLFNNARCMKLTPEFIDNPANNPYDLSWAKTIGDLPDEWNFCVGYQDGRPAKLYHYTQGIPVWKETCGNFAEDELWHDEYKRAVSSVEWKDLMGSSVHAKLTLKAMRERMKRDSNVEIVTGSGNHVDYA